MEIKGIERSKKKKEKDRRKYKGQSIYAKLEITNVSDIFQYLLKLVSAIFYQIFIFHKMIALQKLQKNVFHFI